MGSAASFIGPAFSIGSSLASGSKGGSGPVDTSGGVTPEQEAFAQYGMDEDLLQQGNEYASSGTGMSTMATQGAGGAQMTKAMDLAKSSDLDEAAMNEANQVQQGNLNTSLTALANQANTANTSAGFTSGFNSGGNTGTT